MSRKNSDGSAWELGNGDHICSQHFIKGKKLNLYTNPNYVPSIQAKNLPDTECNAALSHFKCASNHAKLQMERRRQEERIALEVQRVDEEREKMIRSTVRAFNNDHTYTYTIHTHIPYNGRYIYCIAGMYYESKILRTEQNQLQ